MFITSCLFGEDAITGESLVESFYAYISNDEQEILKNCLDGEITKEDVTKEDLLDVLGSYKCFRQPSPENICEIVEELAHQELIQKPKYISMAWCAELKALKVFPEFQSFNSVCTMYEDKIPTSRRVVKLFQAEPKTDSERTCFDHLKRFVKSMSGSKLAAFLQFLTGSNIITVERIEVSFIDSVEPVRRIVAHTCAPLLELPSTFQTYNELCEELTNTLMNSFAWSFELA